MAQPPLSQAIKRLEEDLGVQLLQRSKKAVSLTPAGEMFLREARQTLLQAKRAVDIARLAGKGLRGRLRIGFVGSATFDLLPQVLRTFRQKYADVELELSEQRTLVQVDDLIGGRIDVAILRTPVQKQLDLLVQPLTSEEFVAVFPVGHPKIAKSVPLSALVDEPLITFPPTTVPSVFTEIMLAFKSQGLVPKMGQSAAQIQTMMSLVAGGLGVSMVPESARVAQHRGVALVTIDEGAPGDSIGLAVAWRQSAETPALMAFVEACRTATDIITKRRARKIDRERQSIAGVGYAEK